jgi:phthiocerol/phenolphthiocerol synthesis type-I polyketide synthase E
LFGACKVIGQEYPHIACRLIDVECSSLNGVDDGELVRCVLAERQAASPNLLVAYRGAHRWVRTYEPARRDVPVQRRVRPRGNYLISGGLGGVGLVLARHLAREGAARLALLSRSALPEREHWKAIAADTQQSSVLRRQVEGLLELEALGAEVLPLQVDVSDPAEVQRAVAQARAQMGAIHGVVHAAGMAGGGIIATRTRAQVDAVFAPKLGGTLALLDATRADAPDFVLLCSSLTAITGAFGQSDYCAANGFLDAVAAHESRASGRFVVSVNWDSWREVGMATNQRLPDGVGISPAQGAEVFERLLSGPITSQLVVSTIDLDTQIAVAQTTQMAQRLVPDAVVARAQRARPVLQNPYAEPSTELETDLACMWSEFLGISPIGANDNLFELGGDSLLAIQLIARIRQAYGVEIHPAGFFKAPTVAELAVLIEMRLIEEIESFRESGGSGDSELQMPDRADAVA